MKRFFSSRVFVIGLLFLAVAIGAGFGRSFYQQYQLKKEIRAMEAEIALLTAKKLESIHLLSYVVSPVFVEETARTELNMKKPGERVLVIDDAADARERESIPTDATAGQKAGNPIQWWYYFSQNEPPR